jgi:PAS domain S-box-containing protein
MPSIILIDCSFEPDHIFSAVSVVEPASMIESLTVEQLLARVQRGDDINLVVIGANVPNPVRVTQAIHIFNNEIALLILCSPHNIIRIRDILRFTPLLGQDVSCQIETNTQAITDRITEMLERRRRRQRHQAVIATANRQIKANSGLQPLAAHYLNQILDFAPIGIIHFDAKGTILAWNYKATDLLGKAERDVLGTNLFTLFPTAVDLFESVLMQPAVDYRETTNRVVERPLPAGVNQFISVTVVPFRIPDEPAGGIALLEDVTQRVVAERMRDDLLERERDARRAAEAARERLRYQALLLQNVSDAVISTDVDFNIRSWNPAAELIFGWKADEAIGKSAIELLQTEYPHSTRESVLSQLQRVRVWNGETTSRRKDGTRVHLLASASSIRDKEGQHIGIVSVSRDITEVIKAQQEKKEAAQLRLELEQQTELLRLKEDFISVVSHEFRTPLTVIMSSSELLSTHYSQMPAERQLKHFQVILEQTKYMSALINDVLIINKARAGKLDFNPVPLDLISFCQDILQHLKEVDRGKHSIVFTSGGDLSNVKADVKLLQHILVNLLSNAIKYSPSGGEVHLAVVRQEDEVVFRVSDQGIGIPAESLPHLYEPFYRAKNTGDIGGTGLGTAIVKESVDSHKGTISYESEVGIGTTVTVKLPAI